MAGFRMDAVLETVRAGFESEVGGGGGSPSLEVIADFDSAGDIEGFGVAGDAEDARREVGECVL